MQKPIYLTFWITPIFGYNTSQIIDKEIEAFEEANPDIKINLSVIPWSQVWKRVIAAAKSKRLPDVFEIGNTWTKTLSAINALADITETVSRDRLKDKFHSIAWSTCELEALKRVYALPWSTDARMLFYRKDIFKKLGLSANNLENWKSFEETCRVLSGFDDGTGPIGALGVSDIKDPGLVHNVSPWVWNSGGDFLTSDGMLAAFKDEASLRGIRFYFDLVQKGYAPIRDRKVPAYPAYEFFSSGRYAMCIMGGFVAASSMPWFFGDPAMHKSSEAAQRFGVTFLPSGPGGRFTFLGGTNLALSNHSPNKRQAWQFLKFLTSKEFQVRQYVSTGMFPASIEAFHALFCHGTEEQRILNEIYKNFGRSYRQVDFWASIEFALSELFGRFIDAIKADAYDDSFVLREIDKLANEVNYILSL